MPPRERYAAVMKSALLIFATLLTASCDAVPSDPEGTLDRVRAERRFTVGLIASGHPRVGGDRQVLLLRRIAAATGARPAIEFGTTEALFGRLETGDLDLVLGELDPASPWAKRVSLLPPLAEQVDRDGHVHVAVAARNGENEWIGLLHRQARQVAAMP